MHLLKVPDKKLNRKETGVLEKLPDGCANTPFTPNITLNLDDRYHTIIVYVMALQVTLEIVPWFLWWIPHHTPPEPVSNLSHIVWATWINWTWSNSDDNDFCCVELHINEVYENCITKEYLNKTGLEPSTTYTLSTRTKDEAGDYNET